MAIGWIFPLLALIDYTISPSIVSIYENEKAQYGIMLEAELSFLADKHLFFLYSQNKLLNQKLYLNSFIQGWRYAGRKVSVGFNIGCEHYNIFHSCQHQLTCGFDLKNDYLNLQVRNYYPQPKINKLNYFLVKCYPHTDVDFFVDFYPWELGYGIYFDKDLFGFKGCIRYLRHKWNTLLSYRFDDVKKHSLILSISWDFGGKSKKGFHYHPHLIYKKIKFEPLLSNLPSTPFLVDSHREEEAPSSDPTFTRTNKNENFVIEDFIVEDNKEPQNSPIGGFDICESYSEPPTEEVVPDSNPSPISSLRMIVVGESLGPVTPLTTPSNSVGTASISSMESSVISGNYEKVENNPSPTPSDTSEKGWEKLEKD